MSLCFRVATVTSYERGWARDEEAQTGTISGTAAPFAWIKAAILKGFASRVAEIPNPGAVGSNPRRGRQFFVTARIDRGLDYRVHSIV